MSSANEWSGYIKVLAILIFIAGCIEIVYSILYDGLQYGWSSLIIGILYIICGLSGFRAGTSKHVAAARQYFRLLIFTAVILTIIEVVYLALTNYFVDQFLDDCNEDYDPYNSCATEGDALKELLLIGGLISLGIIVFCCSCCICCARSYMNELQVENYPESGYVVTSAPAGYQAVPTYPAQPAYPAQTPYPSYGQPAYNQAPTYNQVPTYNASPYPQPAYQPYGAPGAYQPAYQPTPPPAGQV